MAGNSTIISWLDHVREGMKMIGDRSTTFSSLHEKGLTTEQEEKIYPSTEKTYPKTEKTYPPYSLTLFPLVDFIEEFQEAVLSIDLA